MNIIRKIHFRFILLHYLADIKLSDNKMKRLIYFLAVFAALTANSAMAQYNRDQVVNRSYEPGVYNDDRGEYRWQIIERRVWIPEYRTRGILGIGTRVIPGHYEMRTDRVKVYTNSGNDGYGKSNNGRKGNHPHGMPPGQRKKQQGNRYYY